MSANEGVELLFFHDFVKFSSKLKRVYAHVTINYIVYNMY